MPATYGIDVPGGLATALLLAGLLGATVVLGLRGLREIPSPRREVLGALRIATAVLALAVAVQPTIVSSHVSREGGRLAVLFDVSRSGIVHTGDDTRRIDEARALAARWSADADDVSASFSFGRHVTALPLRDAAAHLSATEDDTRLGSALAELVRTDPQLGAVVVVSDGADHGGGALETAIELGVRVHTVALGGGESLRDDAIADLEADTVAFLRRPARVRVVVRRLGAAGGPIPVSLREGDRVIEERVVDVPEGESASVDLTFTAERLGRALYTVRIPHAEGDAVPENDARAFVVRVQRDHLRVLHVAGQPSWDQRWLRAFFERDPTMDLISFFILRSTTDMVMASSGELALIPFPTDELFSEHLGSFDVVVFQNFEYAPYQMAMHLPRIRDYVLRGGSLAFLGGPLSFAAAGYAETELAEVLPVEVLPRGTPETRAITTDRFRPVIADGLERHPLVALGGDPHASAEAWAGLSPMVGLNVVGRTLPGAHALLVHPTQRAESGEPLPALALGERGRGRVLALMSDTSWRWGITTGGATGDASMYDRFWDRALRWLTRDPALEPARVTTDRESYGPDAPMEVRGALADERHAPLAAVEVTAVVRTDDDVEVARATARTDADGAFTAPMRAPPEPGGYRVSVAGPGSDTTLAEEPFVVEIGGAELADPRADPELLRALAAATEGRHFTSAADAPDLSDLDTSRVRSLGTSTERPLDSWWSFAVLVALFGAEWILRRRWGAR